MERHVPVRLQRQPETQQAVTRDISPYGVFLYLDAEVAHGSKLEMLLPLPSAPGREPDVWVRCKCRVLRVESVPDSSQLGIAVSIEEFDAVPQAVAGN